MSKIKINIDENKCTDPQECRECLKICPPGVYILTFRDKDYHNPKDWIIYPVFPRLCLKNKNSGNCNICIEKCPNNAIIIKTK